MAREPDPAIRDAAERPARDEAVQTPRKDHDPPPPAQGPHARPDLVRDERTPGTGALPDGAQGREADPAVD